MFFGLIYPYGIVLQAIAILHFVRRRPETYWLWIILMFGGVGALIYIFVEVIPDAGLLRGAFQVFPRRKRIKELEGLVLDNPSVGTTKSSATSTLTTSSSRGRASVSTRSSERRRPSIRFTAAPYPRLHCRSSRPPQPISSRSSRAIRSTTINGP